MSRIQYLDSTGRFEETRGSDSRLNTSSRSNTRSYYVSRDEGQSYTTTSLVTASSLGSQMLYFQNTSTSKKFFLDKVTFGTGTRCVFKIHFVTGTAAGGSALTPVNLNKSSVNDAAATARGDGDVTGLTIDKTIGAYRVDANTFKDESFDDTVILGQNDAIAIEYDSGGLLTSEAVIRGYFE